MPRKKTPVRFKNRKRETCPDCLARDALIGRVMGRPRDFYCETCNGQGMASFAELVGGWPPGDRWVMR